MGDMKQLALENIDLEKLSGVIRKYESTWIAVSSQNRIVASGRTYGETLKSVKNPKSVILFKVPPLDVSLAPSS